MPKKQPKSMGEVRSDILCFIHRYREVYGGSPSLREISRRAERVLSCTAFHVRRLRDEGYLTYRPNTARTIVLTAKGRAFVIDVEKEQKRVSDRHQYGLMPEGV